MSWDQPVYSFSYPSGQPPTPTRTPTSATFGHFSFDTPKAESSFYDAWSAVSPLVSKTPNLKSPNASVLVSAQKRQSINQSIEDEIATHVHHTTPSPNLSLPPVEVSRQLSSSPNPSSAKRKCLDATDVDSTPSKAGLALDTTTAMHSARSMQTPPPTSTSASRRKALQAHVTKLVKDSAANGRRLSTPNFTATSTVVASSSPAGTSAQPLSSLQFSPDVFSFPNPGPVTAPVYPQQKIFWDPDQNMDPLTVDFAPFPSNLLDLSSPKGLDPFTNLHDRPRTSQASSSTTQSQFLYALGGNLNSGGSSNMTMTVTTDCCEQSMFQPTSGSSKALETMMEFSGNVVNPSLLFSSPNQAAQQTQVDSAPIIPEDVILQPYAHQMQESQRETEQKLIQKLSEKQDPKVDSPAVKLALKTLRDDDSERPILKRSITDPVIARISAANSRSLPMKKPKAKNKPQRQFSTSKNCNRPNYTKRGMTRPKKRTAITFSIDANGRAKTETRAIDDGEDVVDSSETERDTVSGGSDTDNMPEDAMNSSQHVSFGDASFQAPKQPKLGHFTTGSRAHSQKSSYNSLHTVDADFQDVFKNPSKKTGVMSNLFISTKDDMIPSNRFTDALSSSTVSDHVDGNSEDPESEIRTTLNTQASRGHAQNELKKVLQDRAIKKAAASVPPPAMGYHSQPIYSGQHDPGALYQTSNPRDRTAQQNVNASSFSSFANAMKNPGPSIPKTAPESQVGEATRCVCHGTQRGKQLMILCESCKKWLHVGCVGVDPERLPDVFLCIFCTGKTPDIREGRLREPLRPGFGQSSSPLAHKSRRFT